MRKRELTKGRRGRGKRAGLTWADVLEIRSLQGREPQDDTALRFSISQRMVSQIQQGKQWKTDPNSRTPGVLDERRCDRFWALVEKTETCWLWRGHIETTGYGRTSLGSPPRRVAWFAHRLAWVITNGPIPFGRWVLHHCDVRHCVRPDHLFLGTHEENMRDAAAKGRLGAGSRGSANGTAKLTEVDVRCIRALKGILSTRDLGRNFGVTASQVSIIQRGLAWKHVAQEPAGAH